MNSTQKTLFQCSLPLLTNETKGDQCDKQEDLMPDSELLEIRVSDPSQDESSQFCAEQVSITPFIQEKPSDIL